MRTSPPLPEAATSEKKSPRAEALHGTSGLNAERALRASLGSYSGVSARRRRSRSQSLPASGTGTRPAGTRGSSPPAATRAPIRESTSRCSPVRQPRRPQQRARPAGPRPSRHLLILRIDVMALSQPPSKAAPIPVSPLIPGSPYSVLVLQEGYSEEMPDGSTRADGTVTLVLGPHLTLVDTGGPWGRERLLAGLAERGVSPGDVQHLVCTHGHSDHAGNLNLFPQAELIVGTDVCLPGGRYLPTGLRQGNPYPLHAGLLEVLPTPGHTQADVSLLVRGTVLGDVLVAGDLFERQGDEGLWQALSEDPVRQAQSRAQALDVANVIVPGHGPPFWSPGRARVEEEWQGTVQD
ncbi:hypothetical protein JD844_000717 [Phrynosoma platyrhinos]|uniref:Metallo-beta-lactamase domain-containing protein 1 n=1 Tax=Phrynosoma platyrhinos TaxID=52577 RepID=A0ABQ7T8G6_PHRPL|nr:hypothetical protein JD844_000717 [Phrynosoma platyrhinos]